MSEWRVVPLGDVCELKRGYDLPNGSRRDGRIPVVSSSGTTGWHDEAKVTAPGVVTGRYGTLGQVFYIAEDFWPLNTALYVRDFKGNEPRFVAALLRSMNLAQYDGAAAVPGLNRNHVHTVPVRVPAVRTQGEIADVVQAFDDLIENNRRRVEVLDEMARAIYREWFVKFRYPGHEGIPLVDSALGPLPLNWELGTVASVALGQRNAIAGGPFGSKLGRKDYQPCGVPVLRGNNLRVHGGFDESDFVFVSEEKAAELRSAWAKRGDIVITQRGTLGQVGRIPSDSKFDLYVLSQSQMKVTVDEERADPTFIYMQLCSPETTQRFVAQAIRTGVPHVNLGLLREFSVVVPPLGLQLRFSAATAPLLEFAVSLERERARLSQIRDLLLPKLVTGQIDVSTLDLDALPELVA